MASSSESSEEEDLEKFAVITDIVNSEVVKFNDSFHSRAKAKPSLRHWREEEDTASSSSELITPELRQHVAKKLSKFLDKNYICTRQVGHLQKGHANSSHDSSGIRLLLSSNHRLQEESTSTVSKKNAINISNSSESDTDDEELNRLTEAAVSGYSIIRTVESTGHNGSREQIEDEAVQTNGVKRKKERKRKKEKRKKTKVDEEKKGKKHQKHKKEKYEEKT